MRKIIGLLGIEGILGILIILFSIAGCSDTPYTGSVMTVQEVDRYLISKDGDAVCFQDDLNATCIEITSQTPDGTSAIHIYPEKRLYLFYHEGKPIVRAERVPNPQTPTGGPSNDDPSTPNGAGGNNGNNNGNNNGGNNGNNGGSGNNGNNNNNNNGNNGNNGGGNNNNNNNGNNNGNNGGGENNNNNGNNGNNNGNNGNNGGGNNNNNGNNGNNGGNNGNNGGGNNNNNNGNNGGGNNNNGGNNGNNNGGNNGNNGSPPDNSDDGHGWIIWVYYPDGAIPQNPPTLSESGVTITINGKQLTDDDITGFAQFIGPNNEVGVQFFYETKSAELLDLKVRMEGVAAADDPVKFDINYLWNSQ